MQDRAGYGEEFAEIRFHAHSLTLVPDQIDHGGRAQQTDLAQRQSTHGPGLLLELRYRACIKRVMA